jgi:hypothetical protein
MLYKSIFATLSILVAMHVATAHPYNEWNHARYRWNDLFAARGREVGARVRSQATVELSSCATVTETMNGRSYRVRVCTADPEGRLYSCTQLWYKEPIRLDRLRGEPKIRKWEWLIRSCMHQAKCCIFHVFNLICMQILLRIRCAWEPG